MWEVSLGARKRNSRNNLYGAREQRRVTLGHPCVDDVPPRPGSQPSVINPNQPSPTPRVIKNRRFGNIADVPVFLRWEGGRFYPPPLITDLRWELAALKRRLHEEIFFLANSDFIAQEWMMRHATQVMTKHPWPPLVIGRSYVSICKDSIRRALPEIRINGNNLENDKTQNYIRKKLDIIDLLEANIEYGRKIYSHFAKIANDNFRGSSEEKSKVTLGRVNQAFECLPADMSDNELLDVAFYGAIDSSMIHMDLHVMSDLLVLTAALGQLRYGRFYPTKETARTYLFVIGLAEDRSSNGIELASARRQLADRIVDRYHLEELRSELTTICREVMRGADIHKDLQRIQYDVIP